MTRRDPGSHLDIEALRKVISYDPETGALVRTGPGRAIAVKLQPTGYLRIGFRYHYHLAHRVAWAIVHGRWPVMIDHINGDRSDNRLCNLREVNSLENATNRRLRRDNTTGAYGVVACRHRYRATIQIKGKVHSLGTFATITEASAARTAAEARLGFHPNHGSGPSEYPR